MPPNLLTEGAPWDRGVQLRAQGAFLGAALGDALGGTTEFMTPSEIEYKHGVHKEMIGGGWLRLKPGQVTDDTQMNLALGQSIIDRGGLDPSDVAAKFLAWMRSKPIDLGSTVRQGLQQFRRSGLALAEPSEYAAGNGAAMRMLPAILAALEDREKMQEWVLGQARITHNNPVSDAGCLFLADLIRAALLMGGRAPLKSIAFSWIELYPNLFDFKRFKRSVDGYLPNSVKTALHFFFSTGDFEACLVGVVNAGGDADTNGALAGMLAGAFYGPTELPRRWLKVLDSPTQIEINRQVSQIWQQFYSHQETP
ncbi:MAG: ADP-ribosyl-[dinitrogen reductase] hydrolase [Candidatus Lambdaproteobacteria bacterium RIFOXYD12_FULL_49_8]|uniref:ADP-ribosyl-[dinitrogen reductase] hydrolase n=1 Tax=Candidatus Lambdaproteobacteria bacterium RIFOXYD2_FULL_50_16 TaxID=1817772 RepID=A0A1F6G8S6_9PROT|nr:MAG: ADP-ribosyl-[dinitrogen reductase] hydrolase [Candidatus Lambdaproteobacteria bacterium RIFOXYD2_FULL_50_16]OGG97345.1 MAG: ADP-ribosyl-[dinitrogen reductase] hydrolase [Candidatus Lambdaproteobacteria bacterium RIFOXYD12_FULL_49_8]